MTKLIDITGKALSGEWGTDDEAGIGIPVLRTTNFTNEGVINYTDVVTRIITKKNIEEKYLRSGDIIIEKSGGSDKQPVGRVIYFDGPENTYLFNNFTGLLRVKEQTEWFSKYVFYSLYGNYQIGGTRPFENKTTGLHNLKIDDYISRYEVPEISYPKQVEISSHLDKLYSIIKMRKKELQLLDDLIKARFVELFGEMKPTTTIARYIAELRGGKSLAGTEKCKNKVLKTGATTFGWFDPEQYKYLPIDYEPLPEYKVETGDVIISRMNTPELVGACSYVFEAPEDMYYPDRLWKVILRDETNPIFLWQLLWDREIRRQIKKKSGGTSGTMHNISKPKLLEIKCIDAPIELQNQFADFAKQIDKSKFMK